MIVWQVSAGRASSFRAHPKPANVQFPFTLFYEHLFSALHLEWKWRHGAMTVVVVVVVVVVIYIQRKYE